MNLFFKATIVGIQTMCLINLAISSIKDNMKAEQEHREGKISDCEMELKNQIFIYQSLIATILVIPYSLNCIELLKDVTLLT